MNRAISSEMENAKSSNDSATKLLNQVAAGDRVAFKRLYFEHYDTLCQFIGRVTRRSDLSEDILNETMLVVWQKAAEFRGNSKVSTWIFGIAYRKALKALEKSERWNSRFSVFDPSTNEAQSDSPPPDEQASELQMLQHINRGLQKLNPEQRAAFELTFYFGYSYPEIAKICDCSVNTVKTRMFHARRHLKDYIRKD